ncbi:MAG: sigma-54-dependent Fis family transcriptional regulator [Bacteroidetes bacterium]|nr:MAG: sigma-54-dependent Fis family transcriptional regulator [Bacteroidota bacterium]PTM14558.1 MAG: sigma-54-dependent Fis family transcriptional regulator [Bacteroidota bacterium]
MSKQTARILIVDDDEDILFSLRLFLSRHFTEVVTESNPYQLPRLLRSKPFDLILLDMNFRTGDTSGAEGMRWLTKIVELDPAASVIMITAYADVKTAVEAVKIGAIDFLEKPWRNERLLTTIQAALQLSASRRKVQQLTDQQQVLVDDLQQPFGEIIGQSKGMKQVFTLIDKVAKTDANVLILGENGTGKELVARAIHRQSLRHQAVFITVDLGAVAESLFESELFGHKKGAFTDAKGDRAGRFEVASGGSLFLDEIGNLSLPLQAKLLSALQTRQVTRVGANESIDVDIRLISATNMPLYGMVADNRFRQDLLYRINTVEITLPPLRDRQDDIPLLVAHYLEEYAKKYQKGTFRIAPSANTQLKSYPWPGNIRELRHAVERAVLLADSDQLHAEDFMLQVPASGTAGDFANGLAGEPHSINLEELERWAVQRALTKHTGNISKAAEELGLTRAALYRRMAKYEL